MFLSKWIPVNVKRPNCVVYSSSKSFDEQHLITAYDFLTGKSTRGVYLEDGCVKFVDDPSITWTIGDIYLAYVAYKTAVDDNFSFYMVRNEQGTPQLFISKPFKGCRILVNAFTFKSVLLQKKKLVDKAASLIDKTLDFTECMNIFNTLSDFEYERGKYLTGLICYKGTDREYLAVNPMTTRMSETVKTYYVEVVDEMRKVVNDPNSSEMFEVSNNHYVRTGPVNWDPMPADHVKDIISLYDSLLEKKSNYVEIVDSNYETRLYFSTNYRYLVNADTFECNIIKNQHTRDLLIQMVNQGVTPFEQISLIWMLSKWE